LLSFSLPLSKILEATTSLTQGDNTHHHYSGATHKEIAKYFGLKHVGSVCYPIAKVKKEIVGGHWVKIIKEIESQLFIVQYT